MSASEAGIVPPVEHVPAPWKLRAEIYWFFLTLPKLPEGVYDPLEYDTKGTGIADLEKEGKAGEFKGGLGGIMIVRYADTPVGKFIGLTPFFTLNLDQFVLFPFSMLLR